MRLPLVFAWLLVLAPSSAATGAENLVPDPSFEEPMLTFARLLQVQHAVAIKAVLVRVSRIGAPACAVNHVLVLVYAGSEHHGGCKAPVRVGTVHLVSGGIPFVEVAGQVDLVGFHIRAIREADFVVATVEPRRRGNAQRRVLVGAGRFERAD